jgi:hypothetical protein
MVEVRKQEKWLERARLFNLYTPLQVTAELIEQGLECGIEEDHPALVYL